MMNIFHFLHPGLVQQLHCESVEMISLLTPWQRMNMMLLHSPAQFSLSSHSTLLLHRGKHARMETEKL